MTSPKQPGRKTRRRTPSAALTAQWFDSWRRANTLGWDYLNAVSGLFRANMSALTDATRLMPPFPPLQ